MDSDEALTVEWANIDAAADSHPAPNSTSTKSNDVTMQFRLLLIPQSKTIS